MTSEGKLKPGDLFEQNQSRVFDTIAATVRDDGTVPPPVDPERRREGLFVAGISKSFKGRPVLERLTLAVT